MKSIRTRLRELEIEAREQMKSDMIRLSLKSDTKALERQIAMLQRVRNQFDGKPGMSDLVNLLDLGIETCYLQHPAHTRAFERFVKSVSEA